MSTSDAQILRYQKNSENNFTGDANYVANAEPLQAVRYVTEFLNNFGDNHTVENGEICVSIFQRKTTIAPCT